MEHKEIIERLNHLMKLELEGVNRYLHHSLMVFGFSRKPIVSYFRTQAQESLQHAILLGEKIVGLGGHPEVTVEARWEPEKHSVKAMLQINVRAERDALKAYKEFLDRIPKDEVALEEMIRGQVRAEQEHIEEMEKYLRDPDA